MKNIYFIFLLICSLYAFTACSDDDNDIAMSELPVTDLKIPATIKQGEILMIEGKGFNEQSQIYLKSVNPLKVEATVSGNSSLSISIPEDFETGVYFIILQQGNLWEIGRVRVIASQESPISELIIPDREFIAGEEFTIKGKGFSEDCQISLLTSVNETYLEIIERTENGITVQLSKMQKAGNYILLLRQGEQWELGNIQVNAYVQTDFRVKQIIKNNSETTTFTYNDEGKVESIMIIGEYESSQYKLEYSEGAIAVKTAYCWEGNWEEEYLNWTYLLENDRVNSCNTMDGIYNWYYTEDNRLEEVSGEYGSMMYTYENGNLINYGNQYESFELEYTDEIPNYGGGVNVMSVVIFSMGYKYPEYFADLLNLSGQSSILLPNIIKTSYDETKECSYETTDNGYITKLIIGIDTFEIKYE